MSKKTIDASVAENIPERVRFALEFFDRHKLWSIVSRNSMATSCRDAANKRSRLGNKGIPLYDELKSLCVAMYRPSGRTYGLLHCRAHEHFDLDAANKLLGGTRPLARLSSDELTALGGAGYGTVTPFSEASRFVQVFDTGIKSSYTPPHTMITNAGDLTWAVEFHPEEVISALSKVTEVHVGNITKEQRSTERLPSIGILTGNGPESGVALWRGINEAVAKRLTDLGRMYGDLSYPRIVVHSLPEMGLSMELAERHEDVWNVIEEAVRQLCTAGVNYIAIACNTTPYFADRIRKIAKSKDIKFISIADVVFEYIKKEKITDITIIGIPVVAELGEFSAYSRLKTLEVHPVNEFAKPYLQELGYLVKMLGSSEKDAKAMNKLRDALRFGVTTENVLIALTEISILLQRFPRLQSEIGGKKVIDPLRLYGEALANLYLQALPQYSDEGADDYL